MGFLEHKGRARVFYRYLSRIYDQVNPLFWNREMRDHALNLAGIEEDDRVLDVGCGTGFATQGITRHTGQVDAVDQSRHQLSKAVEKGVEARFVLGDAENLPYHDDSFDVVWSSGSIEYWPRPVETLRELRRVTKPGGTLLLVGPRQPRNAVLRRIADSIMLFYTEEEATRMLRDAGWSDVRNHVMGSRWIPDDAIVSVAHA